MLWNGELTLDQTSGGRRKPRADFCHGRVGQRGSVAKDHCRHSEIALIDAGDGRRAIGMIFNIDLAELDTGPAKLCLEPYAITTPTSGEDDRLFYGHQIHSHVMYNRALAGAISWQRIALVTLLAREACL